MRRTLIRYVSVGTVVVAVAAVGSAAFAASSNRGHLGPRAGMMGGFGPMMGGFGPMGPFGGPGGHRGGGLLGADVLTPAATYLGISATDLAADLKSGKTLAQEATAKGKSASGFIDAIVTAEKKVFDAQNA